MKTIILFLILTTLTLAQSPLLNLFGDDLKAIDNPPQNLVATSGTGEIILTWNEVKAPDLAGYVIYRDSLGDDLLEGHGDFTDAADTLFWTKQAGWVMTDGKAYRPFIEWVVSSFYKSGITVDGKTYRISYEIISKNYPFDLGDGGITVTAGGTNGVTDTTTGLHTQTLVATAGGSDAIQFIGNNLWDGSVDNAIAYEIITSTSHPDIPIDTVLVGTETFTNTGLTAGTTYAYRIKALDTEGNLSDYSAKAEGTPE